MPRGYNLARMTTATTGTGTITLGSAVAGYLSFAGAGANDGQTVSYAIRDGSNSEVGRGVYTSSGTTLTRSVLKSTNSNNAISLSGTAEVTISPLADDFIEEVNAQTGTTYTVLNTDFSKLVTFSNASSIAVTLPQAVNAFAAGWFCDVLNKGAGVVTITPTTSTIDGAATLVLPQNRGARIVSDGTNYQVIRKGPVGVLNMQAFTASGTFTTPAGSSTATVYRYVVVGAGGGGGGSNGNYSSAGGGGAGGVVIGSFTNVAPSTAITITIGSGGTAGANTGGSGGNGGNSSIGSPVSITANGAGGATGVAGGGSAAASAGGSGGSASGGTVNISGAAGGNGASAGTAVFASMGGCGASGPYGGGGSGGGGYSVGAGSAAAGYGSGGGGGMASTSSGGAGAGGLVLIEWEL